jgi:hypothetical protein
MAKRTNKAIASGFTADLQLENDPKTQKCYKYNLFFISIINFSIFLEFFSFYIKLFWCCFFPTDGCFSVHV